MPIEDPKSVSVNTLTPLRGEGEVRQSPTPLDKPPLEEILEKDYFDSTLKQANDLPSFSPGPMWNPPTLAGKQNNSGTDNATGGGAATPYSSASKNPTPAQPVPSVGDLHTTQWLRDATDRTNPETLEELIKRAKDGDPQGVAILIELKGNSNLLEQANEVMKRYEQKEISGKEIWAAVIRSKNYIQNVSEYTKDLEDFPGLEILTQRDRVILLELQLAPSEELWGEFVELIDSGRIEGQDLAEVLAYGQACIEEYWEKNPVYSSIARDAPYSWYEKAQEGKDAGLKMWGLVNGLDAKKRKLGLEGLKHLLSSSLVKDLKNLDLKVNWIGEEGASYLSVEISSLKNLSRLDLWGNQIGNAGAIALAGSAHLRGLTSLDLGDNGIGAAGAIALAESAHLRGLTSLNLWCNQIGATGARALAGSAHLRGLTSLDLEGNQIGNEGAIALAGSAHLSVLTSLNLRHNQIGNEGAIALAGSAHLSVLTSLDLSYNEICAAGARALAESVHMSSLTSLDLGTNHIGDEGAMALAGSVHVGGLTSLDLGTNHIGDEGAIALAGSVHVGGLTSLNLRNNQIGNEGAIALAGSVHVGGLTSLNLEGNQIGNEGAIALAGSAHLRGLTGLDLGFNRIGDEGFAALRDSPYLQNTTITTGNRRLQPGRNLPKPPTVTPPQTTTNHFQALLLAAPFLEVSSFAQYGLITLGIGAGIYGAPKLLSGLHNQKPSSFWHTLHARFNDLKMSIRKPTKHRVKNKVAPKNKRHASLKISPKLAKGQVLLPGNSIDLKTNHPRTNAGIQDLTKDEQPKSQLQIELEELQLFKEDPLLVNIAGDLENYLKETRHQEGFEKSLEAIVGEYISRHGIEGVIRQAMESYAAKVEKRVMEERKTREKEKKGK